MTDVELLPLPEWTKRDDLGGLVPSEVRAEMQAYARANVEHHTAAQAAEYLMTIGDVRGYANSRANEARAAIAQEDRNAC